jgi:hypothetical protein
VIPVTRPGPTPWLPRRRLGDGHAAHVIEERVANPEVAVPLRLRNGRVVGSVSRGHEAGATLTADVVLENLACKATAVIALRTLLRDGAYDPEGIPYVLNCGEEAVGERYQRGGGNLAKAIAERCGLSEATGADVKAFCCGPVHALVLAGAEGGADPRQKPVRNRRDSNLHGFDSPTGFQVMARALTVPVCVHRPGGGQ